MLVGEAPETLERHRQRRCCPPCLPLRLPPSIPTPPSGLPKLKIEESAARQQAHIDSNMQARVGACERVAGWAHLGRRG